MKLLDSIRRQLRPKHNEKAIAHFIASLQTKLPQARPVLGGSYAKGTSIKGLHDIDVFVKFPKGTQAPSELIAKALPRAKRLHGSRDYFQVKASGYEFELVPVLDIKNWREAENVTDMSPLHVQYIQHKLSEQQKDDVRLAKQFCKSAGVYGAESYIHGFSGHVLELLILHYDSFEKLLKATTKWKAPIIIDIEKHYDSAAAALLRLNEAKIQSPVIIIDPVQPDRNAAAALSRKAFEVFKQRAQGFLKKPGKEYFDIRVNKATIKKQWKLYSILFKTAKTPRGKPDVVGCKLLAKYEKAIKLFKENEFPLVHADWRYGEKQTIAWYVLRNITMPKEREQQGPPASIQAAVETFRAKHPDAYERSGRWHAKVKRKYTKAQDILKAAWNS